MAVAEGTSKDCQQSTAAPDETNKRGSHLPRIKVRPLPVMTHTHANGQGQRSLSSKVGVERDGQTD